MMAALAVVVYNTLTRQNIDIFFSSMLTLILGKYIQQVGFSQGNDNANVTTDTVSRGVINGLNGNVAAQILATHDQTNAIREGNTDANKRDDSNNKNLVDNTDATQNNTVATNAATVQVTPSRVNH